MSASKSQLESSIHKDNSKEEIQSIFDGIERILNKSVEDWSNTELKSIIDNIIVYIDGTIELNVKYFN